MKKFDSGKRKTDQKDSKDNDDDETSRIKRLRSDPSLVAASSSSAAAAASPPPNPPATAFAASAASTPVVAVVAAAAASSSSGASRSPYARWVPTDEEELKAFHKIIGDIQTTKELPVNDVKAYLKLPFQIVFPDSTTSPVSNGKANLNQIGCFIECLLQQKLSGIAGVPSMIMGYLSLHEIGLGILRDRGMEAPSRLFYFLLSIAHYSIYEPCDEISRVDRRQTMTILKQVASDTDLTSENGGLLHITDDTWVTVMKQDQHAGMSPNNRGILKDISPLTWIRYFEPLIRAGAFRVRDIVMDIIPRLLEVGFEEHDFRLPMVQLLCRSGIFAVDGTYRRTYTPWLGETLGSNLYFLADKAAFMYWFDYLTVTYSRSAYSITDRVFKRVLEEYPNRGEAHCKRYKMRFRLLKFLKEKIPITPSFIDVLNEIHGRTARFNQDPIADAEDKEYGCDDSDWDEERDPTHVSENLTADLHPSDDEDEDEPDDEYEDPEEICYDCFDKSCDGTCTST